VEVLEDRKLSSQMELCSRDCDGSVVVVVEKKKEEEEEDPSAKMAFMGCLPKMNIFGRS